MICKQVYTQEPACAGELCSLGGDYWGVWTSIVLFVGGMGTYNIHTLQNDDASVN
jgi:hypothetical protein